MNWEEWADDHGYQRYRHNFGCGRFFWSDSSPECPYCGPDPEDEQVDEETEDK